MKVFIRLKSNILVKFYDVSYMEMDAENLYIYEPGFAKFFQNIIPFKDIASYHVMLIAGRDQDSTEGKEQNTVR